MAAHSGSLDISHFLFCKITINLIRIPKDCSSSERLVVENKHLVQVPRWSSQFSLLLLLPADVAIAVNLRIMLQVTPSRIQVVRFLPDTRLTRPGSADFALVTSGSGFADIMPVMD